jgi:mannose-6-phosphate isomerase
MPPNIVDHFYRGGERIAAFRGVPAPSGRSPEEWLAATVHVAGRPSDGPSRLADGTLFADLVAADQAGWTGHTKADKTDVGLLVKLLDAGQRLPVHVHPTRPFAQQHLHSCYGKTEAWYILETQGDDPSVWVGFNTDVDADELRKRVDAQDSDWLLDHMNKISVRPGDGILVPAGEPHATGAGVFLIEAQEPTDFSILLEWSVTTAGREDSHLGLGFDTVLPAVNHRAISVDSLRCHVDPAATSVRLQKALPAQADAYFHIDLAAPPGGETLTVPHGFAVAIVLSGNGSLAGQAIEKGEIYAIPDRLGDWSLQGSVRVVLCRPSSDWPDIS